MCWAIATASIVEFSESGNRFALMSRPCTNQPCLVNEEPPQFVPRLRRLLL